MPVSVLGHQSPRHDISFTRTVDRTLVHRRAVNEVFLTDMAEIDAETSVVGAQLPISHPYFLDRLDPADPGPCYDALLLAECCRQACTYIAHVRYGVPKDWAFLSAGTSLELSGDAAVRVGESPAELVMTARVETGFRGGRLRSVHNSVEFSLNGRTVGRMDSEGRYLTSEEYQMLRTGERSGPAPSSFSLGRAVAGVPVPPHMVGRSNPRNVFLGDARRTAKGTQARLGVPGRHPTIFEHPLDHVPGMALLDAAVQATSLALALGDEPSAVAGVAGLETAFVRFAELDSEILVLARLGDAPDSDDKSLTAALVSFTQDGASLADVRVLARTSPAGLVSAGQGRVLGTASA